MKKSAERPWFLRNLPLRIISVIIAALMWLLVTNSNNPTIVIQVSSVPVRLNNTEVITDQGKVFSVLDNTDTIPTVYITAPRSIADAIRSDNVVATADLRELTADNTVRIRLDTNIYRNQIESISGSNETLHLAIENRTRKTFTIQTATVGEPAEGYVIGDVTAEQNQLRVSGAESVVSTIDRAVATVDVTGATGNIYTDVDIRLYDEAGNVIDPAGLTMNITKVRVTATVLLTKYVHIGLVGVSGFPASGYLLSGENSITPDHAVIAGRPSALSGITEIMLPAEAVNVSGRDTTLVRQINIASYLPENTKLAGQNFEGIVEVSIGIVPKAYQTVQIASDSVELINIPEGYLAGTPAQIEGGAPTSIPVRISGEEADVLSITPDMISAYVDLAEVSDQISKIQETGRVLTNVKITLPEGIEQEEPVSMTVVVVKSE